MSRILNNLGNLYELQHVPFVVLVRHGKDKCQLDPALDQPLDNSAISDVCQLADDIATLAKQACKKISCETIKIFSSPKMRSLETSEIIQCYLKADGFIVDVKIEDDLRELYQGDFLIKKTECCENFAPLMGAWTAFREQMLCGNLLYRFGDSIHYTDNGECAYPAISGWFTKFGENQAEFSLRMYRFFVKLFTEPLPLISIIASHQAIASRFQRIADMLHKLQNKEVACGDFVLKYEQLGERLCLDHAQAAIVPIAINEHELTILRNELSFLNKVISYK